MVEIKNCLKDVFLKDYHDFDELINIDRELQDGMCLPYFYRRQFNFLEKYFFKRRAYKEYIKKELEYEERKKLNEEKKAKSNKKKEELLKKIKENIEEEKRKTGKCKYTGYIGLLDNKEIESLKNEISEKIEIIDKAESIKDLKNINIEYNELEKLLQENNVKYSFSCRDRLEFGDKECRKDVEFMKRAILEDKELITFDETNNDELYIDFLNLYLLDEIRSLFNMPKEPKEGIDEYYSIYKTYSNCLDEIISEIKKPKEVKEGTYKIPHKYLYEAIRMGLAKNPQNISSPCEQYLKLDGKFNREFGQELEKLYNDDNNILAMHGFERGVLGQGNYNNIINERLLKKIDDRKKRIFKNGLISTNYMGQFKGQGSPRLASTAMIKGDLNFFRCLDYEYSGSVATILLMIPKDGIQKGKNPVPIWGTNDKKLEGEESEIYVNPQYVYGCINKCGEDNVLKMEDWRIEKNNEEPTKYKYAAYDFSVNRQYRLIDNEMDKQI